MKRTAEGHPSPRKHGSSHFPAREKSKRACVGSVKGLGGKKGHHFHMKAKHANIWSPFWLVCREIKSKAGAGVPQFENPLSNGTVGRCSAAPHRTFQLPKPCEEHREKRIGRLEPQNWPPNSATARAEKPRQATTCHTRANRRLASVFPSYLMDTQTP